MAFETIAPERARQLLGDDGVLVDIREADEHARERIPGARHVPLSKLDATDAALPQGAPVIFHCRSGARTLANASRLVAWAGQSRDAYVMEGGLDAWRKAGLPVMADRSQPIELQRQVQIVAGGLGLSGTLLGVLVSPWFLIVPGFVGAGLTFAGLSGFCGMARLLMLAPWNRALGAPNA